MPEKDSDSTRNPKSRGSAGQIGEVVQMVKAYANQELRSPLRGAVRWIGYGLGGALLIGGGTAFLVLGVLRMIQSEWPGTFHGRWMSLLPYGFGLVFCVFVALLALARINKKPLNKEQS
ncbi:MAG: hypothetical protein F2681_05560 [Actinobacteria bacterium]|uniref:Unannotated protein n=1 Tax=freshwater metagenome TaxID=449393 RepID=A0A6J7AQV1_9ZZZZ|nr:hypothetical protein [Actinomycetota bacterium]MSW77485.1 hypothetical protein [Actinomycetota bacterium]MSX94469.1 hypothetical protein [Actinomycetota bacterium]MSZ82591.1 hypothetical protein [Actinomycetota bacterium]MTB17805.1 hypothetical protein [Actinomycetota bacterium]